MGACSLVVRYDHGMVESRVRLPASPFIIMEKSTIEQDFAELIKILKDNRKYCLWASRANSEQYVKHLAEEAEEVIRAVKTKDNKNISEELGDLFWDAMMFALIAEEEGKINTNDIIKGVIQKMKERKPHVFEKRFITKEESDKYWYEAKARQKKEGINL